MSLLTEIVASAAGSRRGRRRGGGGGDAELPSFEVLVGGAMLVLAYFAITHGEPGVGIPIAAAETAVVAYLIVRQRLQSKQRDEEHVESIVRRAGLRRAAPGEFDLYGLPFPIFRQGEWQGFNHVYVGDWNGERVWAFDYWYGFEVRGNDVEEHFTCAAMRLPADCPKLAINREDPWSRTWGHLGWRDIEMESEDFNRRFQVSGEDRTFAFAFLSPSMIEWLQSTPKNFEFAVQGRWLVCRSRWLPTKRWWDLLRMIRDVRGRMPKHLERLYPAEPGVREPTG